MALLVILLAACGGGTLPAGDPARPDLVLVSVDTLRADHLSSYGNARQTSPFLDALAARGARFADARSPAPWTLPAHTSLLTGQRPARHRVVEDDLHLDPAVPLLPERLRAAGYRTGGFVATFYLSRIYGFERGFERFEDFGLHDEKLNLKGEVVAEDVVDQALDWLGGLSPGEPAFLFLHVYDVHYAYDPPAPYDTLFDRAPEQGDLKYKKYEHYLKHPVSEAQLEHQRAQYDEAIRYVDDQLARLSAAMERAGRQARWVVTADHGEEFGERGSWGHAHTLFAEQLHVPLIVAGPGVPARVVEGAVGLEDVAPTLLALAGGEGLAADGLDLGPVLAGAAPPERAFLAETSRFDSNRVGLLLGASRLEWDLVSGRQWLFDVAADPAETHDLAAERPEERARLQAALEAALPPAWEAKVAGRAESEGALILGGASRSLELGAGQRFALLPHDATLRFTPTGGAAAGPWAAVGGASPAEADPLRALAPSAVGSVSLSPEQQRALEALGYVQD